MLDSDLKTWLLEGDVAIQYQVHRDLLGNEDKWLRDRIAKEGWGARFLSRRNENGHWGQRYYQPKWISTHYTLLDLKHLGIAPSNETIRQTLAMVVATEKAPDGGILPIGENSDSDVCVNGMFLNFAAYFGVEEEDLKSVVDFVLAQHMADGGFNCRSNRSGAVHSSLHSTISVAEGILEYARNGYQYRLKELQAAELASREFMLQHRLYKSDHTGEIIDKRMLMLSFPSRWKYDILRALDYFRAAGVGYDARMKDAIEVLLKKRRKDGRWPVQAKHPGQTHFDMEKAGQASRWNTLRALRVLKHFDITE
ncbi:MAG: hypothetical protein DWQ07_22440 [Chloroflexi bacterium]|nr:MAG: hypothetical protein DWQ07_22440 [Chloroflexota bacterium]MBL1193908.1 hypothetical protein [Chloroflexota bacterium]NOH11202.1 hypothetical protein [Chloroflexota bacterium]